MIRLRLIRPPKSTIDALNLTFSTATGPVIQKNAEDKNILNSAIPQTSSEEIQKHHEIDQFTMNFLKNRIETTTIQKYILGFGSSLAALLDPHR